LVLLACLLLLQTAYGQEAAEGRASFPAAAEDDRQNAWQHSPLFARVRAQPGLSLHKDMFALPYTYSNRFSGSETEVVFQLSAKIRLQQSRFYFAYTQRSFWQAYNTDASSPFRETNHNPELFYRRVPTNDESLEHWGVDLGLEHESNGQGGELSRSWNRLYVAPQYHTPRLLLHLKLWYRIPEDECRDESCMDEAGYDDNPDIIDYMGYGEFRLGWRVTGGKTPQLLQLMVRGNPATGKGAVSINYSYPAGSRDLYWFVRYFEGYGESLVDYDHANRRVGIGVLLKR
jgi:phospholipase A1